MFLCLNIKYNCRILSNKICSDFRRLAWKSVGPMEVNPTRRRYSRYFSNYSVSFFKNFHFFLIIKRNCRIGSNKICSYNRALACKYIGTVEVKPQNKKKK